MTGLVEDGENIRRSGRPDLWPAARTAPIPAPAPGAGLNSIASASPVPIAAPAAPAPGVTTDGEAVRTSGATYVAPAVTPHLALPVTAAATP